jgi:hypothetical protein
MASVTLATLRSRVRERADMPVAGFIADSATSIDAFINEGVQRLHEKLVEAYGEEYVSSSAALTTVAGTSDYAVASDFMKLYGIDLTVNGTRRTLKPYMRAERNGYREGGITWATIPRYSLVGGNIRLLPVPQSVLTGTVYYAPAAALLVNTSDAVNFPNGWERYVVLYASIQCLAKEESDTREYRTELEKLERELESLKENRDAAFPRSVVDMDLVDLTESF